MKRFITALVISILAKSVFAWTAYVNRNGAFELYPDSLWNSGQLPLIGKSNFKPGTIGYIPTKLGYLEDEWYVWLTDKTDAVVFKSFTQTPICVLLNSDIRDEVLKPAQVDKLIALFDFDEDFSIERAAKGIIRKSFMEETLGVKAENNAIKDSISGYTYYFDNGYLSSAVSDDGLIEHARRAKGSAIFDIIKDNATKKHNSKYLITKEINFQFWCLANMPPEHFRLAYNSTYGYNIALIWFALYGVDNKAKLSDFMLYVPEAETMETSPCAIIMRWGSNLFIFENNTLVEVR